MRAEKISEIREWLRARLAFVLEWYDGCDATSETLEGVKRDVEDVFREMRVKFGLGEVPFMVATRFDSERRIHVRLVNKRAN